MAEMVPGGFDSPPDKRTPHAIALAVRVAAELGADFVKTPYCAGFEQVIAGCYVPVVVLGGAKRGNEASMLAMSRRPCRRAAPASPSGATSSRPTTRQAMTAAVARVVHGGFACSQRSVRPPQHKSPRVNGMS
jgi:class I fructose-bisphosphate aldolase